MPTCGVTSSLVVLEERIRAELESLRDWAAEQTDNGFADQVRQWAMSKLDRLDRWEADRG